MAQETSYSTLNSNGKTPGTTIYHVFRTNISYFVKQLSKSHDFFSFSILTIFRGTEYSWKKDGCRFVKDSKLYKMD